MNSSLNRVGDVKPEEAATCKQEATEPRRDIFKAWMPMKHSSICTLYQTATCDHVHP